MEIRQVTVELLKLKELSNYARISKRNTKEHASWYIRYVNINKDLEIDIQLLDNVDLLRKLE